MAKIEDCRIWQESLRTVLVEAGTEGIGQREIIKKLEHVAVADEVLPELEFLLNCDPPRVQKFTVPTKGRPKTVWRATVHILKD